MKSLRLRNVAGQIKMRGRKTCSAGCTCCEVQNFKDQEREKELDKEIMEFARLYVEDTNRRYMKEMADMVERVLASGGPKKNSESE